LFFKDYYSFLSEEDEEGNISYGFITDYGLVYVVYFNVNEYTPYVEDFSTLLQDGYAFGFNRIRPNKHQKNSADPKVFSTIHQILLDFFKDKGNNTVLLYHCDDSDNKQRGRNKLFNDWNVNYKAQPDQLLVKHSVEVDVPRKDHLRTVYLGYIISNQNPESDKIAQQFEDFAVALIRPKD